MAKAADFSGRPPGAKALKAAGFTIVIRYTGLGSEGKQIHRAEWEDYLREGILVLLVAELGVDDAWAALDDYATGQARARIALDDTARECPAGVDPATVLMACAADAHASSAAQIGDAVRYSSGFASVVGLWRSGFYGFSETSRAVHDAGAAGWHWRCGSEPSAAEKQWVNFWQRNRNDPAAPARVVINGTDVDVNEIYAPLPQSVEADMPTKKIARTPDNPDLWIGDGINRRRLSSMAEFTGIVQLWDLPPDPAYVDDLDVLGAPPAAGADVDEAALAAELQARGFDGATAAEVKEIVRAAFARAGQPDTGGA